jgi:hypothetical protein
LYVYINCQFELAQLEFVKNRMSFVTLLLVSHPALGLPAISTRSFTVSTAFLMGS